MDIKEELRDYMISNYGESRGSFTYDLDELIATEKEAAVKEFWGDIKRLHSHTITNDHGEDYKAVLLAQINALLDSRYLTT